MSHISHEKTCLTPYANNKSADQPARLRNRIGAFVVRCIDSVMVVPVLVDLRFYVQIKSKQNLESKILQVDGEEKIHNKYSDSKMSENIINFLLCTMIYLSYVNLTIQFSQFDEYPI